MKLARPQLPAILEDATIALMIDDGELEGAQLHGEDGTNSVVAALDLTSVKLDKVIFTGAHFSRITTRDVAVNGSDFSSSHLDNGSIVRTEFNNCRLTGIDFSRTSLHDVVFRGCKLDYSNFRQADLRRVHLIDCSLQEADFGSAKLAFVEFESSQLERTVFEGTTCTKVDLRSSELIDLVGLPSMKGVTIDALQLVTIAPQLAQAVGISVK